MRVLFLKESMAPLAVIPRFAKWSNRRDYSSVVDPGPSSTVAVFVTIRNVMSVDERYWAYAYGGAVVVNARLWSRFS